MNQHYYLGQCPTFHKQSMVSLLSLAWEWLESWPKPYRQHQGNIIPLINNELNLFLITLHTCASMTKTSAPQCPNSTSESKAGSKKSIWPGKSHICNQGQEQYHIYSCISRPFMTKKSAQKIYTSHTQRPDQAVREISITTAWSALGKPVIIVVDFHQFSAHSSPTKKCEIINVKWFKRRSTGDYFYCVFWSM